MLYDYLKRGVVAGLVAGLAYGLFVALVANPLTEYVHGVDHEHAHEHGPAHDHSQAVSEATTAVVSAGSGVLWAIFLGGVFAIALFVLEPAIPGREAVKPYVLAGAGFLTVSVTPWLVLPPAAPGAEYAYGVDTRLGIYAALVALGAVVSAAAILGYRRASPHHRLAGLVAGAVPILAVGIVLPFVTPTTVSHPGLPDDLVSIYRSLVVLSQAAIWGLLAATVGWLRRRDAGATTNRAESVARGARADPTTNREFNS